MCKNILYILAISLCFTNVLVCPELGEESEGRPEEAGGEISPSEPLPPVQGAPEAPVEEGAPITTGGVVGEQPVALPTGDEQGPVSSVPLEVFEPEQAVLNLGTVTPDEAAATFASIEKSTIEPKTFLQVIKNLPAILKQGLDFVSQGLTSKASEIFSRISKLISIFSEKVLDDTDLAQSEVIEAVSEVTSPYDRPPTEAEDAILALEKLQSRMRRINQLSELGRQFNISFENGMTALILDDVINNQGPAQLQKIVKTFEDEIEARRAAISPQEALTDPELKSLEEKIEQTRRSYKQFDNRMRAMRSVITGGKVRFAT